MALTIYKPGQGYWTRVLSAIGAGVLVIAGAAWLFAELEAITDDQTRFIVQTTTVIAVVLGFGALLYWLMNKPNIVDFFIATESEMRKVNWPTRRELLGSTWVVICGTLLLVITLLLIDLFFVWLFKEIGILKLG